MPDSTQAFSKKREKIKTEFQELARAPRPNVRSDFAADAHAERRDAIGYTNLVKVCPLPNRVPGKKEALRRRTPKSAFVPSFFCKFWTTTTYPCSFSFFSPARSQRRLISLSRFGFFGFSFLAPGAGKGPFFSHHERSERVSSGPEEE